MQPIILSKLETVAYEDVWEIHFEYDGVRYAYDMKARVNLDGPNPTFIRFVYDQGKDGAYYQKRIQIMNEKADLFVAAINTILKEA